MRSVVAPNHALCPNCNILDFKQLPPASSRAPFIVHPHVVRHFDFRCLRENRRVVQDESRRAELDCFHTVLTDISHGVASNEVRDFMIAAYVRGYQIATAEHVDFEGSTAVFTRRRYRDKWNRTVVRRVSKKHNHSIKIKACVRPRGVRSQQWYPAQRVAYLRKKCRTQSLWNLHLAGPSMRGVLTRLPSSRALAKNILLVRTPLSHRRFSPLDGDEGPSCGTPAYDAGLVLEKIRICLVRECCH